MRADSWSIRWRSHSQLQPLLESQQVLPLGLQWWDPQGTPWEEEHDQHHLLMGLTPNTAFSWKRENE